VHTYACICIYSYIFINKYSHMSDPQGKTSYGGSLPHCRQAERCVLFLSRTRVLWVLTTDNRGRVMYLHCVTNSCHVCNELTSQGSWTLCREVESCVLTMSRTCVLCVTNLHLMGPRHTLDRQSHVHKLASLMSRFCVLTVARTCVQWVIANV